MQNFVAERGFTDEGKAQDVGAEVGQRRHAKTGGQGTGDDGKFTVRVGADVAAITCDVGLGIVKIALRQAGEGVEFGREEGS